MIFKFNGNIDELIETIRTKASEQKKDIIVYRNYESNVIEIGFQRSGHSGGRFFVADITEENGFTFLNGKIMDLSESTSKEESHSIDIKGWIATFLLVYIFVEIIPLIIWLLIFQFSNLWIPLALPIPILIYLFITRRKRDKKTDENFFDFLINTIKMTRLY